MAFSLLNTSASLHTHWDVIWQRKEILGELGSADCSFSGQFQTVGMTMRETTGSIPSPSMKTVDCE